jgi:hypothetical protein
MSTLSDLYEYVDRLERYRDAHECNHGCAVPSRPAWFASAFDGPHSTCGRIYPVPEPGELVKWCTRAPDHVGPHSDGEVRWTYRGLDVELVP